MADVIDIANFFDIKNYDENTKILVNHIKSYNFQKLFELQGLMNQRNRRNQKDIDEFQESVGTIFNADNLKYLRFEQKQLFALKKFQEFGVEHKTNVTNGSIGLNSPDGPDGPPGGPNSFGNMFVFYTLFKKQAIKTFCGPDCKHGTNDCVSPIFINYLFTNFSAVECNSFFQQQAELVKQYSVPFLSINTLETLSIEKLDSLKPYFGCINTILWNLLKIWSVVRFQEYLKDPIDLQTKILFFIQFLDNYGDHINIFEKFFDAPRPPPKIDFHSRIPNISDWRKYIEAEQSKPENFKTIIDLANQCLVSGNKADDEILVALETRLSEISQFRNNVHECLHNWILPDIAKIIELYTLPKQ